MTTTANPQTASNGAHAGAAPRTNADGVASVARYRQRWTWERVAWTTHCGNCIANCPYRLYARDGTSVTEEPSGGMPGRDGIPDMNPLGCQKGAAWQVQRTNGDRVLSPLRRVGPRGSGRWEEIGWDEAYREVAGAIIDALEEDGPESIWFEAGAESGVVGGIGRGRLAGPLDAVSLDGNATVSDIHNGHWLTFGNLLGGSTSDDQFRSEVLIIWNGNPAFTRIPYFHYIPEARYNGATVVHIGPDFSPSAVHADWFVPVRIGSDAALALSLCRVIVDENLADWSFVRSQTDLPLLVKADGRYLRDADVNAGGRADRFFAWLDGAAVAVDPKRLDPPASPRNYALEGEFEVTLADGSVERVTTVFSLMKARLDEYAPEDASAICGVAPATIRELARLVATKRTKVSNGLGSCKHYHGDLMERAMDLVLALTGNWGKPGTGFDTYIIALLDGEVLSMFKTAPGAKASEAAIGAMDAFLTMLRSADPDLTEGQAFLQLMRLGAPASGSIPPVFFYWYHCGFDEIWGRDDWTGAPRPMAEYIAEARSRGWWSGLVRPDPDVPVRVMIQAGTNVLRRTRGGQRQLLKHLWPGLRMAVAVDFRMNTTGLMCDLVLPVAVEGEKVDLHGANSHSWERMFADKVFEPAGNSLSEWDLFAGLAEAVSAVAAERGLTEYKDSHGGRRPYAALGARYSRNGRRIGEEAIVDEVLRDSALSGNLPAGTSLYSVRETGWVTPERLPRPMSAITGSEISQDAPTMAYRNHVEDLVPFETLTGRAQFLIDHPWFIEADEALPRHKDAPVAGGDYPLRVTGGHPRWSIHASNTTNQVILETTRGGPAAHLNPDDAAARGVADGDLVEIFNDLGAMSVPARVTAAVRPGQVVLYASWEPHLFPEWKDLTWVEPGIVKWLHFAAGYGHLGYTPMQWQPIQADRNYAVDVRRAG